VTTLPAGLEWDEARLKDHCETVVINMLIGKVTPVLGTGASLYGRGAPAPEPGDGAPTPEWRGAPSAGELAAYLAKRGRIADVTNDLLQVAQWGYAKRGSGALYAFLHERFDRDFPPTGLHQYLAEVPSLLRDGGRGYPPLIVTTNYDDLVERALDERNEAEITSEGHPRAPYLTPQNTPVPRPGSSQRSPTAAISQAGEHRTVRCARCATESTERSLHTTALQQLVGPA
jgi:hypothetical protein